MKTFIKFTLMVVVGLALGILGAKVVEQFPKPPLGKKDVEVPTVFLGNESGVIVFTGVPENVDLLYCFELSYALQCAFSVDGERQPDMLIPNQNFKEVR